jgi:hypothetical protein
VGCDAGSCAPTAIVLGQLNAFALAVDPARCGGGAIFWATRDGSQDGGVYMAMKDGQNPHELEHGTIEDLKTSDGYVAWAAYSHVGVARMDGGDPRWLDAVWGAYHIALYEGAVYWGSRYGTNIARRAIDEGPCADPSCAFLLTQQNTYGVAVDGTGIYWSEVGGVNSSGEPSDTDGSVRAALLDGAAPRLLSENLLARSLVLGPERIYWIGTNSGSVQMAAKDGGVALPVVGNADIRGLTVFEGRVYVSLADGRLLSADLNGSDVHPVLTTLGDSIGIAVDDVAFYWIDLRSGALMRLFR